MPRKPRWEKDGTTDGIATVTLLSWKYFSDFVNQELLDYRTYIYRGHASDRWKLESTLDRALKRRRVIERNAARQNHLETFIRAARGRRGPNPRLLEGDNAWWALGQHHGLATPLLDFTESPFLALYFAFEREDNDGATHRVVWGVSESSVVYTTDELLAGWKKTLPRPPVAEIVRPLSDENPRLVSQRALFVRTPAGMPLENWTKEHHKGEGKIWHLFKIRIPNAEWGRCLRFLNRMNINHLSLFPDLYGSTQYCNTDLLIKDY